MAAETPQPSSCCSKCGDEIVTAVPGPQGATGAAGTNGTNGTNGTDGISPFTTLTDDFTMPNSGASGTAKVADTTWMFPGQILNVEGAGSGVDSAHSAGYLVVVSVGDSEHVDLLNASSLSFLNKTPGGFVANGGGITPSGPPGSGTLNSLSPTTTKGDLIGDNGAGGGSASNVRFAVGADGTVLTARSSQATGLQWSGIDLSGTNTTLSGTLGIGKGGTGQTAALPAFNALSPLTTVGDTLYHNGTNNVRLAKGTALQGLRMNAGATAPEWATISTSLVLQYFAVSTAILTTIAATIPADDTIPQIGEGAEILSQAITPSSATSRIRIEARIPIGVPFNLGGGNETILALFTGATNAIAATSLGEGSDPIFITLEHTFTPGSVTPITLSLRIGDGSGTTFYVNGTSTGTRRFGGVQSAWMNITEYA